MEIDTPQIALVADQAGDYRVDVDPRSDTTRVQVLTGAATVYGASGQATEVAGRQSISFAGRNMAVVAHGGLAARDGFDQWVATRDAQWQASASARHVSPDIPGVALLDRYGEWAQDATYGSVWYPQLTVVDWAPYRYGEWRWVDPWGWTWVDDAPWGLRLHTMAAGRRLARAGPGCPGRVCAAPSTHPPWWALSAPAATTGVCRLAADCRPRPGSHWRPANSGSPTTTPARPTCSA